MGDNPGARRIFSRLRSSRSVSSHGNRSTPSLPATSQAMPEAGSTPLASPDACSRSPFKLFRGRSKGASGTSSGSPSPAPTSRSSSSRALSWFRRLVLSPNASATGNRTASASTLFLASPTPAVHDLKPTDPEALHVVSGQAAISPKSPPEQAQEALERGGRLNPRAPQDIERVPGTWEAASSTVELWEGVVSKLSAFTGIMDAIGEVHPYLKAATGVVGGIVKPIVAQDTRDDNFENLLKEMKLAYDHVVRESGTVARLRKEPATRQTELLNEICNESAQCARFIEKEYIGTFWARAAKNVLNGGDVDKTMQHYTSSFSSLRTRWQEEVLHFQNADRMLEKLLPMRPVGPANQRPCLQGTRIGVLGEIRRWIDKDDSTRVLFVLGVAGSGKTSLANTVAEIGHEQGILGSFVAFNRNDPNRVPERLLGTVAHHLGRWNEGYRDRLSGTLQGDAIISDSQNITKQWERLIVDPAASISFSRHTYRRVLVVIDAFDECPEHDDDSRQRLLDCLTRQASDLPTGFRLLVTSRPIERVVAAVAAPSVRRLDLSSFPVDEDIYLYVRKQLPLYINGGLSDWDCHSVARAADGVFQWAATACRFLANKLGGTTMSAKFEANRERLFHGDPGGTQRPGGPPSLDELYSSVLDEAFDTEDATAIANFRSALAMMLSTTTPLSIDVLQSIYDRARPSCRGVPVVQSVLGSMGVVLEGASSTSSPIRPMHLTFREFLLDASRSGPWHISDAGIAHGHRILALGGLRIMASDLRFNMHSLPSSLSSGIEERQKGLCPHPTLGYITLNLYTHLQEVLSWGIRDRNRDLFRGSLSRLLYNKFLFWMEWSLICGGWDKLDTVLEFAQEMLTGKDRTFAKDAALLHGLLRSTDHLEPPHVYLSGLACAPANSLVRQHFMPHFRGIPTIRPLGDSWEEIQHGPRPIQNPCLAWSINCRYIRENGRFPSRCWDARTGDAVDVPPNMDWRYASLESADGRVKVSLSQVRGELVANVEHLVCPADTSPVRSTIETATYGGDHCADVSPDGNWLVIVTGRNDLKLWNLGTGLEAWQQVPDDVMKGQMAAIFSPNSCEIVSSGTRGDVHYIFPINQGTENNDPRCYHWVNVNFKPEPQVDANGEKFPDAHLRCTKPDICVPVEYYPLICQPGVRLVLGGLRVDYTDACYGTKWADCYAGTIEAEESEDEYAGVDVEREESKVGSSGSKGKRDDREDDDPVRRFARHAREFIYSR